MTTARKLQDVYDALLAHYGPRKWWPAETPFEVMVGAILTQNTSWKNVEKAIHSLKVFDLLDIRKIHELDEDTLAVAIKSSGTFRIKAHRLKILVKWLVEKYDADLDRMRDVPLSRLREQLLELQGIGPETADSILLYALNFATFVVDRYTWRLLTRHNLIGEDATYDDMKELFERHVPRDEKKYNEFHAQIVAVGNQFCRAKAKCEECPLKGQLPGRVPHF